ELVAHTSTLCQAAQDVGCRLRDVRLDAELAQKLDGSLHLRGPSHGVPPASVDETIDEVLVGVAQRRFDVRAEPLGAAGGLCGGEALENGGGEALHEDAAHELSRSRVPRLRADDVDRDVERTEDLRVACSAV